MEYASEVMESKAGGRVLVVDDERDIRELVAFNLEAAGFAVTAVGSAEECFAELGKNRQDAVVLDLMLPDLSGVEVCRRIRATPVTARLPVLMLTARGDEYDRLLGFEVGADDYVLKPFSVREIVHRVRVLTRRAAPPAPSDSDEVFTWRGLTLDSARGRVSADGKELALRPLEFRLLEVLMRNRGTVLTRAALLEAAWGQSGDTHTRTVDTHVRRLREALGGYDEAVETLRGFGYRLRDE